MTTAEGADPVEGGTAGDVRQARQLARQQAITEAVMAEGAVRIERLAERFDISVMTVHRDLDELEARGLLRKGRGIATATSTSLIESSDRYRSQRQIAEKEAIALAALELLEPGQAVLLDDSTTVLHLARHLASRAPLTAITNSLTAMTELRAARDVTLLGLGGRYADWCSAFLGGTTVQAVRELRADVLVMSTAAVVDDVAFHQAMDTVDVKRAMFAASRTRILLVDHTKFARRALHATVPLADFDVVVVDAATPDEHVRRLRRRGVEVRVAP